MDNDFEAEQLRPELGFDLEPDWRNRPQAREVAMYL
jgi:hypothetical protein